MADIAMARGRTIFPDINVQVGQEFYVTASRINKRDVEYYGGGGACYFSAEPNVLYAFSAEANGTILTSGSSTYVAPAAPGEYRVDCSWWSPVPPYEDLIPLGSAKVIVSP